MAKHSKRTVAPTPEGFRELQWFGYAGILVVFGIAVSIPVTGFEKLFEEENLGVALFAARLVLFGVLVVWSGRWLFATRKELTMWLKWRLEFDDEPAGSDVAVVLVALYLGLSMAFVGRPVLLTSFFSLGLMFNIWTQRICNRAFAKAAGAVGEASVPKSMVHYWTGSSQYIRLTLMAVASWIAFGLALMGSRKAEPNKTAYYLFAYWTLIADITVGEIVINALRRARDKGILDHIQIEKGHHDA